MEIEAYEKEWEEAAQAANAAYLDVLKKEVKQLEAHINKLTPADLQDDRLRSVVLGIYNMYLMRIRRSNFSGLEFEEIKGVLGEPLKKLYLLLFSDEIDGSEEVMEKNEAERLRA